MYWLPSQRSWLVTLVCLLLVAGCDSVPSHGERTPEPWISGRVSSARLEGHVRTLAEEIGERNVFYPRALHQAAGYIESAWREQGYAVTRQTYAARGVECSNLEVTLAGRGRSPELVLIGAHYDSVHGSPGANDNGSGVAALLELSRVLAQRQPDLAIRFVAFVNEEPPFYYFDNMGSMVYAAMARRRGDQIRLMISLETMGYFSDAPNSQRYPPLFRFFYPDRGNFIGFVADLRSRRWLRRTVELFQRYSDFPTESVAMVRWVPGVGWSDHLSFWRQGYPALMVTDTALYRYPWYHTASDTPDKLDYAALARVTEGLAATLLALAAGE